MAALNCKANWKLLHRLEWT